VEGAGDDIQAERISADLRFQRTNLTDARFRLSPSWFEGRVTDDFFVRAGEAQSNERGYFVIAGQCTTCNDGRPHYHIGADRIEIFPSDRIILRGARINILGSTILKLPALTIPLLENSNPRYLPLIGQSRDEGYFIKSRFATPVGSREVVDILADAMSKLGFGIGAEYANNSGTSRVYSLFGNSPSLTASQNYNGKLGGGNLSFDGLFLRNNYAFAPETTTTSLRANRPQAFAPTTPKEDSISLATGRALQPRALAPWPSPFLFEIAAHGESGVPVETSARGVVVASLPTST